MGGQLWQARFKAAASGPDVTGALDPLAQLAAGLSSALLNPQNMVFYLTPMTVLVGPEVTLRQKTLPGCGCSWWFCCGIWA